MTPLERRDRRRARKVMSDARKASQTAHWSDFIPLIAAALKREREETGMAAIGHLFAKRDQKNARKAFEANHGKVNQARQPGVRGNRE